MLKSVLPNLDGVQEEFKQLYVQDGEEFRLNIDGMLHESEVGGLKSALDKERDRRRELVKKLETIPSAKNVTSEEKAELEKLRQELEEREMRDAERRGEFDKVRQTLIEKHSSQLDGLKSELEKERGLRIRQELTHDALGHISRTGGIAELLLPLIEKQTRYVDVDGVSKHVVIDDSGEVRYNEKGAAMMVGEYIQSLRDDPIYGHAFRATGKTGTESPVNRSRVLSQQDPSKMTADQKIQLGIAQREQRK